ncbi:MAG: hypothetical protein AAFX06_19325 [Planctomycetota bacterium]
MSDDDFEILVAEVMTPSDKMAVDAVKDSLAQRVLLVLRGQKEPDGASEKIWSLVVRQEATKRTHAPSTGSIAC